MSAATLSLPSDGGWPARISMSVTLSVAIHVLLLAGAALLLHGMPATVGGQPRSMPLSATMIALPPQQLETFDPMPLLTLSAPMRTMMFAPVAPLARTTPLPGVSAMPANIQVIAEFIPVGRISYGTGDGKRLFGPSLRVQMATQFANPPARPPRLDGSLSVLYPVKGAAKGQSLSLSAVLTIDERGKITEARVQPDDPVFVAAVLSALNNARFYPAELDGKPVPYWTVLDFNFAIDGPTGPDGKRLDR